MSIEKKEKLRFSSFGADDLARGGSMAQVRTIRMRLAGPMPAGFLH
ncbi:hypothetical protein [Pyramidobacter sp. C12-8]|nr:hypothetical protein [Pyramidobacter sp. C12-8]